MGGLHMQENQCLVDLINLNCDEHPTLLVFILVLTAIKLIFIRILQFILDQQTGNPYGARAERVIIQDIKDFSIKARRTTLNDSV
jgi:hypothetical protein